MFPEVRKDSTRLLVVQFQVIFSVDTQIIHVDLEPLFSDHVGEDVVHKCLKSWWGITKTKKHDSGLKEAKGGDECGLPLIFLFDADVVVSPLDVELGKESGVLRIVNQLRGEVERVAIANSVAVR